MADRKLWPDPPHARNAIVEALKSARPQAPVQRTPELRSYAPPWHAQVTNALTDAIYGPRATARDRSWVDKFTGPQNPFNALAQVESGVGNALAGYRQGNAVQSGLGGLEVLGALPFVPGIVGALKKGSDVMSKKYDQASPQAKIRYLSSLLRRNGWQVGHVSKNAEGRTSSVYMDRNVIRGDGRHEAERIRLSDHGLGYRQDGTIQDGGANLSVNVVESDATPRDILAASINKRYRDDLDSSNGHVAYDDWVGSEDHRLWFDDDASMTADADQTAKALSKALKK